MSQKEEIAYEIAYEIAVLDSKIVSDLLQG